MAKPKLALIPAAQGGKLYSVLPSSGVGDFDFTRSGSATRINSQGLIETVSSGVSRLNYPLIDGVVKGCPHHILEPQRTNLVQYSDINTAWNQQANLTNSLNQDVLAPDGTINGWKATRNINTSGYTYMTSLSLAINTEYTVSIWVKASDLTICNEVVLNFHPNSFASSTTRFNFETESITGNGKVEKYPNGWYRISLTSTSNATIGYFDIGLQPYLNGSQYWGGQDGDVVFYAYGTQVEQGSYPTSYIPTTTSPVTRSAETANGSGDATTFNDSEGVLMAEISALGKDTNYELISISDGTNNIHIDLGYNNTTTESYKQVKFGGDNVFGDFTDPIDQTTFNKIAIKYKSGDSSFYVNGFEIDSSSTEFTPTSSMDELKFSYFTDGDKFFGNVKQLQYYDTALTDSELETLTSWVSFTDMAESQLYSIE